MQSANERFPDQEVKEDSEDNVDPFEVLYQPKIEVSGDQEPFAAPSLEQEASEEEMSTPMDSSSSGNVPLVDDRGSGKMAAITNNFYASLSAPPGTEEALLQHGAVIDALTELPGKVTIRHKFGAEPDDVLNVISFRIEGNSKGLEDVANVEGVIGIYPVRTRRRPKTVPLGSLKYAKPSLDSAHILTGVKEVQERLGVTGKGIKVGIIDTGVDYNHPALGGCFGPGCKVAYGYDFVGDDYDNGGSKNDGPRPDNDPMDCAGHGTHVAGIVAARNQPPHMLGTHEFVGVAPDVTIGAYRVFGCEGEVSDDVLLAALKQAYRDGMDIVNLSLGGASGWPEEPFAIACSAYIQKGLHIAVANGNDGDEGLFEDGAPATANGAIAVGSVDNTHFLGTAGHASWQVLDANGVPVPNAAAAMDVSSKIQIGVSMAADDNDVPVMSFRSDITYVLELPDDKNALGCAEYVAPATRPSNVQSQHVIALLKRGECSFSDKAEFIKKAKLGGMLVYDTVLEQRPLGMAIMGLNISAGGLAYEDAQQLLSAMQSKPPSVAAAASNPSQQPVFTIQFLAEDQLLALRSGGKMSDFSSWGPDARLKYKPDIVTPGGLIYSTFPLASDGFATLQGTSMASPYMAGVMALYLSKYGKTAPERLLQILQSSAKPVVEPGSSTSLSSAFQQGAGLVSVLPLFASEPPTDVQPTALFLNDTQYQQLTHTVTLHNPSPATTRVFTMVHRPALSVNGFDTVAFAQPVNKTGLRHSTVGIDGVTMSPDRVVLAPGSTAQVTFTFQPPTQLRVEERWLYSGFLELECQVQAAAASATDNRCDSVMVSYGGLHGYLATVPILGVVGGLPALELDRMMRRFEREMEKDNEDNAVVPQMFSDQRQVLQVGKNGNDWVHVVIAVNFPTDLLTIEVESVCDGDHTAGSEQIRIEIPGNRDPTAPGIFRIETAEEIAQREEEEIEKEEEQEQASQQQQHLQDHDQASPLHSLTDEGLGLRRKSRWMARANELAFMPGGLYQPYKDYSRLMVEPISLDNMADSQETQEVQEAPIIQESEDEQYMALQHLRLKSRAKGRSRMHTGGKGFGRVLPRRPRGFKELRFGHHHHQHHRSDPLESRKKRHEQCPRHGVSAFNDGAWNEHKHHHHHHIHLQGHHHHHHDDGNNPSHEDAIPSRSEKCVPRILGVIPSGYNPWTSRTDGSEENSVQVFEWEGDLLIENHAAFANEAVGQGRTYGKKSKRDNEEEEDEEDKKKKGKKDKKQKDMDKPHHHHHDRSHHKKTKEVDELDADVEGEDEEETRALPDGRYRLVVKAVKPWGVRGRAADVERWSSPIIVIKRR
ncbi:hypothetical protein BGZ73_002954 [Actinomortierella ambigua]|nr:hypothetical protein BGZ73_002954 [Actinomortierella ambigua]